MLHSSLAFYTDASKEVSSSLTHTPLESEKERDEDVVIK